MKVRLAFLVALVACTGERGTTPTESASAAPQSPGPVLLGPGCDALVGGRLPSSAWWQTAPPESCVAAGDPRLTHAVPQLYDTCVPKPWSPLGCEPLPFGSQLCDGGKWKAICAGDDDCGPLARCVPQGSVYGMCEKSCGTDLDCIRCDMTCETSLGVCSRKKPPPGPACTADCECTTQCCRGGMCAYCGAMPRGLCEFYMPWPSDCACTGGVCDARHCCILPDGRIAQPFDPECGPPDAGTQ